MKKNDNNFRIIIIIIVIFNFLLTKCKSESDDASSFCSTQACVREAKNILDNLDTSFDACDDFYLHVCGGFINNTSMPDDKTAVDVSTVLDDNLKEQINSILNTSISARDIEPFKYSKKLYKACMNQGNDTYLKNSSPFCFELIIICNDNHNLFHTFAIIRANTRARSQANENSSRCIGRLAGG